MNSSLSLWGIWQQGDWVTCSVALFLLLMSIVTWLVIAIKLFDLWCLKKQAKAAEHFWHSIDFDEALQCLGRDDDFHILIYFL